MKNKFLNSVCGPMVFLVLLTLIAVIPNPTFAATKGGVNSGSIFYTFDILLEKANLAFTFNKEKKVQKIVNNTEERLAEAETAAIEGKTDIAEKAILKYQDGISSAFVEAKKINNEEKSKEVLSSISDNISRHQDILTSVYNSVPESAKESVEKAIAVSVAGQEKIKEELEQIVTSPQVDNDSETENQEEKEIKKTDNKSEEEESEKIEKLKKEVGALKVKTSQIKIAEKAEEPVVVENNQSSSSQASTSSQTKQKEVTLPNGTVVEMDENGNIVGTIKEVEVTPQADTFKHVIVGAPQYVSREIRQGWKDISLKIIYKW